MDDRRPTTEALVRVLARVRRPAVATSAPPPFTVVDAPPGAAPPPPASRTTPAAARPPDGARPHQVLGLDDEDRPDPPRPAVVASPRPEGPFAGPAGQPLLPEVEPRSSRVAATVPAEDPPAEPPGRGTRDASLLPEVEVILDPVFPPSRDQPARPSVPSGPVPGSVTPGTSPDRVVDAPQARSRVADASRSPWAPTDVGPAGTPSRDAPARDALPPSIVIERIDISSPPPTGAAADPLASLAGRRRGRSRQPTPPAR